MNRRFVLFFVILAINTCIAVGYAIFHLGRRTVDKKQRGAYQAKTLIMLLCPVIGPLFFLCGELICRLFLWQDLDLEDVIFSKERARTMVRADAEREGNLVPIEEALAVSDKESLRTLVMNVVRGDVQNSLASIALALNSEDSETSHYAATVLRDALNDFRRQTQELYNAMRREEEDAGEYAELLIQYMNDMLTREVFHDAEQKEYVAMMEEAGAFLYEREPERLTAAAIEQICMLLLKEKEFVAMERWCGRSRELYPDELSTYTCYLKLYFTMGRKTEFFAEMEALRGSDVVIDRETLELIRTFC